MAVDASSELPIEALVDHIERTHHAFTRREISRLRPLLGEVLGVHGQRHEELAGIAQTFAHLVDEVEPHMLKEEMILFPAIRAATSGSFDVEPPIRVMLIEHEEVMELLKELRERAKDFTVPADASASYRELFEGLEALEKDLIEHIELEDEALFPRALSLAG